MKKLGGILLWVAISIAGASSLAVLALRRNEQINAMWLIVAALGVGGAPGGDKDEVCARAGVARVADRIPG